MEDDPAEGVDNTIPNNIEAEQSLLGALLYDTQAFETLPEKLAAHHFYEPLHARLFEAMLQIVHSGGLVEPIALIERFRHDEAFAQMGAGRYLAQLIDNAPPWSLVASHANVIFDLAIRRDLIRIGTATAYNARKDRKVDGLAQVEDVERSLFELSTTKGQKGFAQFSDVLTSSIEMAAAAFARDGDMAGMATGLIDLDKKLRGLRNSDLIIIGARPSMGKTALATNIAFHVAKTFQAGRTMEDHSKVDQRGGVVAVFSLEMAADQLGTRILAAASGVSPDRMSSGDFDISEFSRIRDAAIEIQDSPLYIDDTGAISIAAMTTRCRRLKRTVGLDLIVVDYLQLATVEGASGSQERVALVAQGLKTLAKDLNVPVVALSQVSRRCEERDDKRPLLSDLRDSGAIEQDADVVIFLYRHAYYLEKAPPKEGSAEHLKWEEELDACRHTAEAIIAKNRKGATGVVKLSFEPEMTRFGNLAREDRSARD